LWHFVRLSCRGKVDNVCVLQKVFQDTNGGCLEEAVTMQRSGLLRIIDFVKMRKSFFGAVRLSVGRDYPFSAASVTTLLKASG